MSWAALAIAFIAALIMAANQAMKDAPILAEKIRWTPINGRWNYLPLGIFLLAILVWGLGFMVNSEADDVGSTEAAAPETDDTEASDNAAAATQDSQASDSTYLEPMDLESNHGEVVEAEERTMPQDSTGVLTMSGVPMEEIDGYYEEYTSVEADRYAARYHGRPVSISGTVRDVRSYELSGGVSAIVDFERETDDYYVYANFDNARQTVLNLRRGTRIEVRCPFPDTYSGGGSIHLYRCELTGGPYPPITN